MDVLKASTSDYDAIIDFANYVFTGVDFPTLLPKLYANHPELSEKHYLIKENNHIVALLGAFDLSLNVCDEKLKVKGIGTVSVHRYKRNHGYMKAVMQKALSDIEKQAVDFVVLGGERQRYEYYNFIPAGLKIKGKLTSANIKHLYHKSLDCYRFVTVTADNKEALAQILALNNQKLCYSNRDNTFEVLSSWQSKVTAVYQNNDFVGYIIHSEDHKYISEIVVNESEQFNAILISFLHAVGASETDVTLQPFQTKEIQALNLICEEACKIESNVQVNIFNFINTLRAFMKLQAKTAVLPEGQFIIDIKEHGRYKITLNNQNITVCKTEENYDLQLDYASAILFLFTPASYFYALENPIAKAWFPLPLCFHHIDNV